MIKHVRPLALLIAIAMLCGCATSQSSDAPAYGVGAPPQDFDGLGGHTRAITTGSPQAQHYFNQGLNWMYAFNHDEAVRSFTRAAELDPECAMAWWGIAYCQGPNYNDPVMTDARSEAAWLALRNALARIDNTTPVERDLIHALQARYANPWPEDRARLEQAFADAMAKVWEKYPNDSDVATLYAESMMVQRPWMLYTIDQKPEKNTPKIVAVLERAMDLDPYNPGAKHLYIHAVEPSTNPDRGLAAADALIDMVPASGHLNHMPSHIYVQTGHWHRSIEQNAKAMHADDTYRTLSPHQGLQHMYMVHNAHMLAFSAMMVGREKEAMAAARDMWADVPEDALKAFAPFVDLWMTSVYDVQKRFGRWDVILAEPAPPKYLPITTAVWRAHRAIAYAAKKNIEQAEREYELFRKAKAAIPKDSVFGQDSTHRILDVSDLFVAGEIALQQEQWDRAAELLEKAAKLEDGLWYGEPPAWLQPVRHTLGAMYLKCGRYSDAERVYRADLKRWRNNGWSLYGLSRALEMQGKHEQAAQIKADYERVWQMADEPTKTSCRCIPVT